MADEQEVGVIFPLAGLETTCEFGRQPKDTTPQGVNVRTYETITQRARGGSRSGLDQYIPEQVNGFSLVQHLDILIDPQQPALSAPASDGPIPDPSSNNLSVRNPGRGIRRGGSGKVPNRNIGGAITPAIAKVQSKFGEIIFDFPVLGPYQITLDTQPLSGSILVAVIATEVSQTIASPSDPSGQAVGSDVRNGDDEVYTQIGAFCDATGSFVSGDPSLLTFMELSVWYRRSVGSIGDQTVKVNSLSPDPGSVAYPVDLRISLCEFSGMANAPFFDSKHSGAAEATITPGVLSLANIDDQAVLVAVYGYADLDSGGSVNSITGIGPTYLGFTNVVQSLSFNASLHLVTLDVQFPVASVYPDPGTASYACIGIVWSAI